MIHVSSEAIFCYKQNETRNQIIRTKLYMDITTFGVAFAACVCSIFGMNLDSGIESDPYDFYLTILTILVTSSVIITFGSRRFSEVMKTGGVAEESI